MDAKAALRRYAETAAIGRGFAEAHDALADHTLAELGDGSVRDAHSEAVEARLRAGKDLRPEVLADHPFLARRADRLRPKKGGAS